MVQAREQVPPDWDWIVPIRERPPPVLEEPAQGPEQLPPNREHVLQNGERPVQDGSKDFHIVTRSLPAGRESLHTVNELGRAVNGCFRIVKRLFHAWNGPLTRQAPPPTRGVDRNGLFAHAAAS